MAWSPDSSQSTVLLQAFDIAWRQSIKDYEGRLINSEHCLQAALYCHLRGCLPESYRVFVEAVVRLGETGKTETGKNKVVIDLVVEEHGWMVAGIELKFTPRGEPTKEDIRKDLTSLAFLTSRRATNDQVTLEMPRFHHSEAEALRLRILPQRKLIFAAFCLKESMLLGKSLFWEETRPVSGYWSEKKGIPTNFAVYLARTEGDGTASMDSYGLPLDRLAKAAAAGDA